MSISIQSNSLFAFNRTLSNEYVQRAINSSSKDEATHVGIWEKIKDWFCATNASEALEKIYDLTHNNDEPDTESILKKVTAFYQLKEMSCPAYQDRFQASITQNNEEGTYTFSFSIKDVMDKRELVYGSTEKDVYSLKERELTNNSELLDNDTVIREGLDIALNKVKYDGKQNKLEGVSLSNQGRVNLHLLNEEAKQEMAINQRFAQKWISLQMKCFDYYAQQRSSLDSIDGMDITKTIGTENEWIYHFAQSINEIKRNTQEKLSQEINNRINELNGSKIHYHPGLDNEAIYSEPYNQSNTGIALLYEGRKSITSGTAKIFTAPTKAAISAKTTNIILEKIKTLCTKKPDVKEIFNYAHDFIKKTDYSWHVANKENQLKLFDHAARREFNRGFLLKDINKFSLEEKKKMLINMESKFGIRLRGITDFIAEKVGYNSENNKLISTASKYTSLMEDITYLLKVQVGEIPSKISSPLYIKNVNELNKAEINAISDIGIKINDLT